ncbi:FMN-binding protein [Desulfonema magnum]|uniref:Na(+)-translocating NADH-quinone reductase subunit C n=1 Tax=Desulfonema magnum TaxID=45655 RepID=A0A975BQK4_9BACT|nr:FMN-binding protein [Desulfonema magnum]QTA89866.1 NqrC: Na(+)-translocating NADH-quinone reductase, subunit C [Desulfonema magnum]
MSSYLKSFVFAAIMCFVCSILLTAASSGLKEFQQKNIALDKQKNVLKSVGLIQEEQQYSPEQIETVYAENIRTLWINGEGKIIGEKERGPKDLQVYLNVRKEQVESYIIPIETRGLWGKIFGYLAIKNDGSTISGFTVYKHSETPGLGGEIEKGWFRKNFEGKKIIDSAGGLVSVSVAKGAVSEVVPKEKHPHFVDGISGATLTGKFLSTGLKEILLEYEPVSVRFRKNRELKTEG